VATITMSDIRQAGVSLTVLAEQAGVNYGRLWRQTHGGLQKGLDRHEVERLERVLADHRQPA
jgi:hypothetical protein